MSWSSQTQSRLRRAVRAGLRFLSWRGPIAVVVFLLGLVALSSDVGFTDRPNIAEADLWTHIYYTFGLFVLGGMDLGMPSGGPFWARGLLWFCYFAAPAITTTAVIEGLIRAIRAQSWYSLPPRRHVVIAGAGRLATLVLERMRASWRNKKIIVVDLNPDPAIEELLHTQFGVELIAGDINNPLLLESINLEGADRIFLLTGDDFANLDAATRILSIAPTIASKIVIHVSDIRMVRLIRKANLLAQCEIFNSHHIAAAHLVHTRLLGHFESTHPRDIVVIAGFGRFGQTLLDELQRHADGAFDTVVILDTAARLCAADFQEQVGFSASYHRHIVDADLQDPAVWWDLQARFDFAGCEPVFILGCGDEPTNIRTAIWLSRRFPQAFVVARIFSESPFAEALAREARFEVVSVAALVRRSMPRAWFRFPRLFQE